MMRLHCLNTCLSTPGFFSCAIDTIFDWFFFSIFSYLETPSPIASNMLLLELIDCCRNRRQTRVEGNDQISLNTQISGLRNRLWDKILESGVPTFDPKGNMHVVLMEFLHSCNDDELVKQYFTLKVTLHCKHCLTNQDKSWFPLMIIPNALNSHVCNIEDLLTDFMNKHRRGRCCKPLVNFLQSYHMPEFLFIELPSPETNIKIIYEMRIKECMYRFNSAIISRSQHFICITPENEESSFIKINDLAFATEKLYFHNDVKPFILSSDHGIVLMVYHKVNTSLMLNIQNNNIEPITPSSSQTTLVPHFKTRKQEEHIDQSCESVSVTTLKDSQNEQTRGKKKRKATSHHKAVHKLPKKAKPVSKLFNEDQKRFTQSLQLGQMRKCCYCKELIYDIDRNFTPVQTCNLSLKLKYTCKFCTGLKPKTPALEVFNIPDELRNLTIIEKRFISMIHPFMNIIVLPGGQFGEKGHMIAFPVNSFDLLTSTLSVIEALNSVVIIKTGQTSEIRAQDILRLPKLLSALEWMKNNNDLYKSVNIDECIEYLQTTMTNNNASKSEILLFEEIQELLEQNVYTAAVCLNEYPTVINVPINSLIKGNKIATFPHNLSKPLGLFKFVAHFEEKSFPWLFPTGSGGYSDSHNRTLTLSKYFKSRLLSFDTRWQNDLSYLFFALTVTETFKLSSCVGIAVRLKCEQSPFLTVKDVNNGIPSEYLEDSYAFMKQIRGYSAYMRQELRKLICKVAKLGPPTFFVSLSSADTSEYWPEMSQIVGQPINLSKKEQWILVRRNPVLVARFFRRRWLNFKKLILKGKSKPLGEISDYYARIEFQMRGSPHLHILLWIKGAPILGIEEQRGSVCSFVNKYISSTLPSEVNDPELFRLVISLQTHKHTTTCQKKRKKGCRFDIPYPLCPEARLRTDLDIGNPSRIIIHRRLTERDRWINPYNPYITLSWRANHDIQFVGSFFGLAAYICAYMCKSEPLDLKQNIALALNTLPNNATLSQKLYKIGHTYLSHRQISAQECAWRLLEFPYTESSRTCIYVNARPPTSLFRLLKPRAQLSQLSGSSNDIFCSNIIDYYAERPKIETFENMCLAQYASEYNISSKPLRKQAFEIIKYNKFVSKRTKPACIMFPTYSIIHNRYSYLYSKFMLYCPWRNLTHIVCLKTLLSTYRANELCIENNMKPYENSKDIQEAIILVRELEANSNVLFPTDTESNEQDAQSQNACFSTEYSSWSFNSALHVSVNDINSDNPYGHSETFANTDNINKTADELLLKFSDDKFEQVLKHLSPKQNEIVCLFNAWFDDPCDREPIRLFLSGPGGSGKSFLISILQDFILRKRKSNAVLVCATTGVASENLGGVTVHSALALPIAHSTKFDGNYLPLSASKLNEFRNLYADIKIVIIDEISMLSLNSLEHIHLRLCEIFNSIKPFGNLNIIFVGDLFQLKPVCGKWVFDNKIANVTHLWHDLVSPIFLPTNFRQANDPAYAELLCRLRYGQLVLNDIIMLTSIINAHHKEPIFDDAIRIYPTRKQCREYNEFKLMEYYVIRHKAIDCCKNIPEGHTLESLLSSDPSECGGLDSEVALAVGAHIMITRNICQSLGLINGKRGVITRIETTSPASSEVTAIFIRITTASSLITEETLHTEIRVLPIEARFRGKQNVDIRRTQFPICVAWAATIHKTQGQTLNHAVISLGKKVFAPAQAYVALSRVKTLLGLSLEEFDFTKVKTSQKVLTEMDRLTHLKDMFAKLSSLEPSQDGMSHIASSKIRVKLLAKSCLKETKSSSLMFSVLFADESGFARAISYDERLYSTDILKINSCCELEHFRIKTPYRGSTVGKTPQLYLPYELILDEKTVFGHSNPFMEMAVQWTCISEAIKLPTGTDVNVRGRIMEKPEERTIESNSQSSYSRIVAEIPIMDSSKECVVVELWEEAAKSGYSVGEWFAVYAGRTKKFRDVVKISTNFWSIPQKTDVPVNADNDALITAYTVTGKSKEKEADVYTIDSVGTIRFARICPYCKEGIEDKIAEDQKYYTHRIKKCGRTFNAKVLSMAMRCQFSVSPSKDTGTTNKCSAEYTGFDAVCCQIFGQNASQLIKDSSAQNLCTMQALDNIYLMRLNTAAKKIDYASLSPVIVEEKKNIVELEKPEPACVDLKTPIKKKRTK